MSVEPPPPPAYAHPKLAGNAWIVTDDGARWLWNGSGWELVDPPGTHQDAIRQHSVVRPLLDLATRCARDRVDPDLAVSQLRDLAGSDTSAFSEAAAMIGEPKSDKTTAVIELLKRASIA
jgi:hypothetical protein